VLIDHEESDADTELWAALAGQPIDVRGDPNRGRHGSAGHSTQPDPIKTVWIRCSLAEAASVDMDATAVAEFTSMISTTNI
jgi:hypothetical protein